MSLSIHTGAYTDCYELFDAALAAEHGVRMPISLDETEARMFQFRMNQARKILRDQTRKAYTPDSPQYNTSDYDGLQVKLRQSESSGIWYVYVEPHGVGHLLQFIERLAAKSTSLPPPEPSLYTPRTHQLTHEPTHAPDTETLE